MLPSVLGYCKTHHARMLALANQYLFPKMQKSRISLRLIIKLTKTQKTDFAEQCIDWATAKPSSSSHEAYLTQSFFFGVS